MANRFSELDETLRKILTDVARAFEKQNKGIESDVDELKAETASLRADNAALRQTVEAQGFEIQQLRDDYAALERSAKVVAIRGDSA